jgi:hypothetical protein
MPGQKALAGVGSKEQRQHEHIKDNAEHSGRYGSRAKEVATRTITNSTKRKASESLPDLRQGDDCNHLVAQKTEK